MTAYRNHGHLRNTVTLRDFLFEHAVAFAAFYDVGEQTALEAQPCDELVAPILSHRVGEPRGGSNRAFGDCFSRKEVGEKVGHQQHFLCPCVELAAMIFDVVKLKNRIILLNLHSREPIQLVFRHNLKDLVRDIVRAVVAVVNGTVDKFSVLVQQTEVHAPGIYAYRVEAALSCRNRNAL